MIITENQLKKLSSHKFVSLNEEKENRIKGIKNFSKGNSNDKPIVFLSHKHDELWALEHTIELIKNCGIDLYIDWMDEEMPKKTCSKTAEKIKEKIKTCDRFVFIGTEGAIASKWCNWELGIGDVNKSANLHIAVLPVKKDYNDYSGNEYLELYPTIQYQDGNGGYIIKEKRDNTDIFVLPIDNGADKIIGKIPAGYYLQILYEDTENTAFIQIKLEEWFKKF